MAFAAALVGAGRDRDAAPPGDGRWRPSPAIEALPQASHSGFDRERLWSGYDDWEPVTAADPSSPYVYQLTTRLGGPRACATCAKDSIIFRRSRDRGATWEPDRFLIAAPISQFDPQIRVANDGTVFAAFLLEYRPGVTFMRSTDHGTTWSVPTSFSGKHREPPWSDRPALVISPSGRDVYIAFNHSDSWVVASHDGGRTFAPPVQTSRDNRYYFHSAGTVAPDGSVDFIAEDYVPNYHGNVHIDIIRSSDGGTSWSMQRIDESREPPSCRNVPGCYLGFLGPVGGIAADASGALLAAYNANDRARAPQGLYARTSTDGVHWSARSEISGTGPGVDHAFPAIAAGPEAGDFRVVWMDARTGYWNAWYRQLTGGTWSEPVRLSDRRSGTVYTHSGGFDFPYGDYLGVSVDARGGTYAIWGAGPNYNGPGGTWFTRSR